jgi:hypothetical protein
MTGSLRGAGGSGQSGNGQKVNPLVSEGEVGLEGGQQWSEVIHTKVLPVPNSCSVSQTLMSWILGSLQLFFPFLPWAGPTR